jgi:hypothetical protein
MTEVAHTPADDYEQLPLEFGQSEGGAVDATVPPDVSPDITHSEAYQRLVELRDTAYRRRRSGARAIAREAFVALQAGDITKDQHRKLFTADAGDAPVPRQPEFEELSADPPPREFDYAERAAGEAVRRPADHEN